MTITELVTLVTQKFDNNTLYYDGPSVVTLGINPAMRLITLVRGNLLVKRALVQVNAETATVNLRMCAPEFWRVSRVVLGDARGGSAETQDGRYKALKATTLQSLAWKRDWLLRTGEPSQYWLWGDHWLGVYPRPTSVTQLTVIYRAMPYAFTVHDLVENPGLEPELSSVIHPLIVDVAAALVMLREGAQEIEKAVALLQGLLSMEQLRGMRRLARQQQPLGTSQGEAVAAGAVGA